MNRTTALPRPGGPTYLTDGGLETCLVFHDGLDLPAFASYPLLADQDGRDRLTRYYEEYLATAVGLGLGFVLETPTWRANPDWGGTLGHDDAELRRLNGAAVGLLHELRTAAGSAVPVVISGCIGPRGDGYQVDHVMTTAEAAEYHARQIGWLGDAGADLVSALTIGTVEEAAGFVVAATRLGLAAVVSFTVETDGCLPSGTPVGEAIERTDDLTGGSAAYYMLNCAHPTHLEPALAGGGSWAERVGGYRPNASTLSHAELDEATTLDDGEPDDLASRVLALRATFPNLAVLGGCCGTDHRHVEAIARAWTVAGFAGVSP